MAISRLFAARRVCSVLAVLTALYPLALVAAPPASAVGVADVVTVRAQTVTRTWTAYGQIVPLAVLAVRVVDPGTLGGMQVVPGSVVAAGQTLARVGGPRIRSLLNDREQALHSARAQERAARRTLAIVRRERANQLVTRQVADVAQRDWQVARAAVRTAATQLGAARALQIVRAPVAGTVLAVDAADGEEAAAGETILTLLPAGKSWIRAASYGGADHGADGARLRPGMTGRFRPSGGGDAIPVRVVAVDASIAADGGRSVGLLPTSSVWPEWWANGLWGTVQIDGPPERMVAVPTAALILDRGRWWALVRTAGGDEPREVTLGPTRGWQTWVASGIRPGQQVVVRDAFLEYHRRIADTFQPPD